MFSRATALDMRGFPSIMASPNRKQGPRVADPKRPTPREMMEMATEAMARSRPEPKDDGSAPLYVGASVLFEDGRVDSACRGEFRYGDHAEFTLLERKHLSDSLDGAWIFPPVRNRVGN